MAPDSSPGSSPNKPPVEGRPAPRGRQRLMIVIAVLVVLGLAANGILSRRSAHAALVKDADVYSIPTVATIHPQKGAPDQELVLPGAMQAFVDTPIYARTSGYLKQWYVDIGAHVKKGQLMAEIETPEVDDQLRQARAYLSNAQANYVLAQTTATRWNTMLKSSSVSKQETDEKVGDMLAKKATLDAAHFNVARLEKTQSFQKILAPFDGIVTARNTDVGALIDPGSSGGVQKELFHVANAQRMRIYVDIPQAYAQAVKAGLKADLTLNELPGKRFHGVTVRTAGAVDPVARTMRVEVDVDNATGELLPGAYVQVHFKLQDPRASFLLPGNALLFRPGGVRVATVDDHQRVKLLPIVLGTDYGKQVAVASGLSGTERIILNPQDSVVDGQQVRLAPATPASGSSSASGAAVAAAGGH
jgi:RND family efflux transporter MFP subunit